MLNITIQWQDPDFFCYKSILQKIMSHAETHCAQHSSRFIRLFKGCRRKTGPAKLHTDRRKTGPTLGVYVTLAKL